MPWSEREAPIVAPPSRHMRVWLDPARWRAALADDVGASIDAIDRWVTEGRAVVARRRDPGAERHCFVALALPGKVRIPFVVERAAVLRIAPPLRLDEAIDAAPVDWQPLLRDLIDTASRVGVVLHVYGSLAWQSMAGVSYITATSDLDLVWCARNGDAIGPMIASLAAWEGASGIRADGEVLFDDGDAVSWRELASGAARVLAKRDDGVALRASPLRPPA